METIPNITESEFNKQATELLVVYYIPKIESAYNKFLERSISKDEFTQEISKIITDVRRTVKNGYKILKAWSSYERQRQSLYNYLVNYRDGMVI